MRDLLIHLIFLPFLLYGCTLFYWPELARKVVLWDLEKQKNKKFPFGPSRDYINSQSFLRTARMVGLIANMILLAYIYAIYIELRIRLI